ncbi:MAG: CTP synthetase [Alphaproteobacteria bacterium]|nr:MAG: CTP synthetase [Alphaproteobacteria bacterium]
MGLFLIVYILAGVTLAGIFMVAVLTIGLTTAQPVVYSALAGFVVGIPVAWVIARMIRNNA